MVKFAVLIALLLPGGFLSAQEVPGNTAPPLLQRPYEAARDFLNVYAFADATLDSNGAYLNGANTGSTTGFSAGGGANGYHQWSTGVFELTYRGDYHDYGSGGLPSGNDQNLSIIFQKSFSKRWNFVASVAAGILNNGGTYYSSAPNPSNTSTVVQTNPFSFNTKFVQGNVSLSYQKSVRLSYSVSGTYFLTRYSANSGIGSNDITGSGSANYRLTKKSTLSGTYSHGHYIYQRGEGNSNVDSAFLTMSYQLAPHWSVSGSGGVTRETSNGLTTLPVLIQVGSQFFPAVVLQPYSQTSVLPYYQGTLVHDMRHDSVNISGGQSITPGNGYLLASKSVGINGLWAHAMRRSNLSVGGYYDRLTSATNTASLLSSTRGIDASYAYNLAYHIGVNARYDLMDYSSFGSYGGRADNRFSLGIYVSSKDVPLGLF